MRYELEKFFSNPCEASGLLITEAPTGYGKTYETKASNTPMGESERIAGEIGDLL